MPLRVERVQESDIPRLTDIFYAAFNDEWDRIMFPQVPPQDGRATTIERWRREAANPDMAFMKVVDTDRHNEILAFARWYIYRKERPESDWKSMEPRDWDEGTNVEAANEFFNVVRQMRQNWMAGNPHCCLNMLACDPKHHRRGAGRMLVLYGTNIADEADALPCYLESTSAGSSLYKSAGFEVVDSLDIDMSKYGAHGTHRHEIMIRPVKGTDTS